MIFYIFVSYSALTQLVGWSVHWSHKRTCSVDPNIFGCNNGMDRWNSYGFFGTYKPHSNKWAQCWELS